MCQKSSRSLKPFGHNTPTLQTDGRTDGRTDFLWHRPRPNGRPKTASTIATSIVHSKLDYCNSLYHNFPNCQLNRLQQIQNSVARAVVKAPESTHITPVLKSLHWLKVNERIEYKLLSLTYKVITTAQPSYLRNLMSLQPPRSTRSSSVVTLSPPTISSLKITDRSLDMHHLVFGINFQIHSVSLTILVSIHLLIRFSTQAQNLPFQQILPTVDFVYLYWTASR